MPSSAAVRLPPRLIVGEVYTDWLLVCASRSFEKTTQGGQSKNPRKLGRLAKAWSDLKTLGTAVAWQHTAHTVRTVLQPLMTSLQRPWSYWEHRFNWGGGKREYNELDLELFTFGTVEDFWSGYQCAPSLECVADVCCAASWPGPLGPFHSMLPPHHNSLPLPPLPACCCPTACLLPARSSGRSSTQLMAARRPGLWWSARSVGVLGPQ